MGVHTLLTNKGFVSDYAGDIDLKAKLVAWENFYSHHKLIRIERENIILGPHRENYALKFAVNQSVESQKPLLLVQLLHAH
ncbi:hypothetical protein, partial [Vibrio hepatarius]|uniref:hypothetical protein n=1 Tax=Vibrio hepatarius TaxID=171383 RepID=UPI001C0880F8